MYRRPCGTLPITKRWAWLSNYSLNKFMTSPDHTPIFPPGISRRQVLNLAVGAASLPAFSRAARSQNYPSRPVRIIVGFTAGGASDITARLLGQWLTVRLGQQFIIENRPGA